MNKITGNNNKAQFQLTNLADTLTIFDANFILFLKQINIIKIKTDKTIQRAPTMQVATLFCLKLYPLAEVSLVGSLAIKNIPIANNDKIAKNTSK